MRQVQKAGLSSESRVQGNADVEPKWGRRPCRVGCKGGLKGHQHIPVGWGLSDGPLFSLSYL